MSAAALFWDIVPYVTIAILVVGTWWRYRYDKFGWTTRSSQLYESRLLRIGSPLFHFGILVVIIGHVIGLLIPESWTSALGLSEQGYHLQAVALGSIDKLPDVSEGLLWTNQWNPDTLTDQILPTIEAFDGSMSETPTAEATAAS